MNLIIFTGAPASGKSSFATALSKKLSIPWASKDAYKIELFEKCGFRNHAEKKKLSLKGEAMLIDRIKQSISCNKDLIVDNNFKNFDSLRSILDQSDEKCKIICFYLYADSDILAKRYNERISSGQREQSLYTLNVYPVVKGISEFHKPLTAEQVDNIQSNVTEETFGDVIVKIDTNAIEKNYDDIFQHIVSIVKENIKEM